MQGRSHLVRSAAAPHAHPRRHVPSQTDRYSHLTGPQRCRRWAGRAWLTISTRTSDYDNPALYSSDDQFSEASYWDQRYRSETPTTSFEWYRSYASLATVLRRHLPLDAPLLQIGVGTSQIQRDMVEDGYSRIVSIDYSREAIRRMAALHAHIPELEYEFGDARSLPHFADASFGGVLDKGTLDALLCGDCAEADAAALLREAARVLRPGACYLMITSARPEARLPYLLRPAGLQDGRISGAGGTQQEQMGFAHGPVGSRGVEDSDSSGSGSSTGGSSTSSTSSSDIRGGAIDGQDRETSTALWGRDGVESSVGGRSDAVGESGNQAQGLGDLWRSVQVYEVGQQGALEGPYDATDDAGVVASLPQMVYSHFVYVCQAL